MWEDKGTRGGDGATEALVGREEADCASGSGEGDSGSQNGGR